MSHWKTIEDLAKRVIGEDGAASWPALMAALQPKLQVLVRYQKIGRLRRREDDLRNIVVKVFEKLSARDFAALRSYFAMAQPPSFTGWLRRVVRTSAIDYMRQHPEYRRAAAAGTGSRSSTP